MAEDPVKRAASIARWRAANAEKVKASKRQWAANNREKVEKWARENPEKVRAMRKRNSQTPKAVATRKAWTEKNPESLRRSKRRYYVSNLEECRVRVQKWREANPEKARAAYRAWAEANPESAGERAALRYERLRLADVGDVTDSVIVDVIEAFGGACAYCGVQAEELDHFVPISRGGLHTMHNLVPSCGDCNRRKHGKDPFSFLHELARLRARSYACSSPTSCPGPSRETSHRA